MARPIAVVLIALLAAVLPAAAGAQERMYRIGTVSGQLDVPPESFAPFTDYLSTRIAGADFVMVPLPTIEALIESVDARRLDFALITPVAFVALSSRHQVRPIATVTQRAGGSAFPWLAGAVFVKAARTDIQRLEDVRRQRVVALSPLALGGWLSAVREWRRLGVDPQTSAQSVRFIFSYANVVAEVCAGNADVGVLAAGTLREVWNDCPGGFRVLPAPGGKDQRYPPDISTRLYPEAAFAVVGDVPEPVVTRVTQELLAIEAGSAVAVAATVAGFTAPLSYAPVRDLMEELRLAPFERFGQLTFTEALRQHSGKVTTVLLTFVFMLGFAVVRARRDIAERKRVESDRARLERQLHHSQRMDSIGRLAGAVAHDFNNLLTVINGYTEVVLDHVSDIDPIRKNLIQVSNAGHRAAQLTQQLLTFSRKQVYKPKPIDLNAMLHESAAMFDRLLGEEIRVVTREGVLVQPVMADQGQLHQVIINLAVNARDAMPRGGTLTLSTATATLNADDTAVVAGLAPGEYAVLKVADTGVGMDTETQQHIFEPFFSTKGESGTGLGLSTVYGIVHQLQGEIAVSSTPGEGTTFTIYLPVAEAGAVPAARPARPPVVTLPGPRTVLVVEDQPAVRAFARDVLLRAGYHVLDAASGDAALLLARDHHERIDLLLTDVVLRGMNGRELAEQFTERYPSARVLFTSGYTDDVIAQRGVILGIDFLPKPYSVEALLDKVREVLDGNG
jgi:signal transduction histidine kinase